VKGDSLSDPCAKPRISVVIPAYNSAATIGECLAGMGRQTFAASDFETIVADDGSTDGTPDVAERPGVRVLRLEHRGPAATRNRGALAARGDLLLFTDADCVPDPDWVEAMARIFEDPTVAAVKGVYRSGQDGLTSRFAQVEFEDRYELLDRAGATDMVDTHCAGFRAELFRRCGGFDERFPVANNEDTDLSYRLAAGGHRLVFSRSAGVRHLRHPGTPWEYWRLKFRRGYWRAAIYRRFPRKVLHETYTPSGLKLQVLALGMLILGAGLACFAPAAGLALAVTAAGLLAATTVRLWRIAWRRDRPVCFVLPVYVLLRASALGLGGACGVVFGRRLKPEARPAAAPAPAGEGADRAGD